MKKIFFLIIYIITLLSVNPLGNELYSPGILTFESLTDGGLVGSKDFIHEQFTSLYRIKSDGSSIFTFRLTNIHSVKGFAQLPEPLYMNGTYGGFEYLHKIFTEESGFFIFTDFGGGTGGPGVYGGFGLGRRGGTCFYIDCLYEYDFWLRSFITFDFILFKYFSIGGRIGLHADINNSEIDPYLIAEVSPGANINDIFKFNLSGGVSLNEKWAVGFILGLSLTASIRFYH